MPETGEAADTTQNAGGGTETAGTQEGAQDAPAVADCSEYVGDLLDFFAKNWGDFDRLTADAQRHLERTVSRLLCYSFETTHGSDAGWWKNGDDGELYWKAHALQIARRLNRIKPRTTPIGGKVLDEVIDEYGEGFLAGLEQELREMDVREFAGLVANISRREALGAENGRERLIEMMSNDDELRRAWIEDILTGCPFRIT